MKILFTVLLTVFAYANVWGNYTLSKSISVEDGLGGASVKAIVQDTKGFIWIATSTSIQRFDGYELETFYENSSDLYCLDETPQCLYVSADGTIWFGTNKSLYYMQSQSNVFSAVELSKGERFIADVLTISDGTEGDIFIGTRNSGIFHIKNLESNINQIKGSDTDEIITLSQFDLSQILVSTKTKGLFLLNTASLNTIRINDTLQVKKIFKAAFDKAVLQDNNNRILELNTTTFQLKEICKTLSNANLTDVCLLNANHSLLANKRGLYDFFVENDGNFECRRIKSISSFLQSEITEVFLDKRKNIWIGTKASGVQMFTFLPIWYDELDIKATDKSVSNTQFVTSASDSLYVIANKNSLRLYTDFNELKYDIPLNSDKMVKCVKIITDSLIIIGTEEGILTVENGNVASNLLGKENVSVCDIASDGEKIWLATENNGLYVKETGSSTYKKLEYLISGSENVNIPNTLSSIEYSNGELWIGTCEGIILHNVNKNTTHAFKHSELNAKCLNSNVINCIHIDSKENVWVGSNNGLNRYVKEDSSFESINYQASAFRLNVKAIVSTNTKVFLSTNRGLVAIRLSDLSFHSESQIANVESLNFESPSYYKNSILFAGKERIIRVYPEKYPLTFNNSPTFLTKLKVFNKEIDYVDGKILTDAIVNAKKVTLSYTDNFFTLTFSCLDYKNSQNIVYAYKMKGYDEEWTYTNSKNRYASYANLPPGEYSFMVKASSTGNLDQVEPLKLMVVINPPFWNSNLFLTAMLVLFLGIVYLFLFLREKRMKNQNELLNEKVQAQTLVLQGQNEELTELNSTKDKFMSIIAHDLKNPLNSLIGFTELLHEKHADYDDEQRQKFIDIINKASKQMYELLTNLFDWSRTQTGKINFKPVQFNIKANIHITLELLQHVAKNKEIIIEQNINAVDVFADKNMISTIVRNLVSNSIKFTPKGGLVEVFSEIKENIIEISVRDNGVGMDAKQMKSLFKIDKANSTLGTAQEHGTGLGLILCKEFIKMNKGKITVQSEKGVGSTFTFTIPLP